MATTEITVVVPCYNYGHYLPQMIESCLRQNDVNVRVLVVDDASPDGSGAIAEQLAAQDARVTCIRNPKNLGHIGTFNLGLAAVETKYVTLVSADDVLAPGALARATALMEAAPRVGLVYGKALQFADEEDAQLGKGAGCITWTVWPGRQWLKIACWRGRNFMLSPEVVMRTAAVRQVGLYNFKLPHTSDLEFWLRTSLSWDIGRINGPVQAYYRVHSTNMHLMHFNSDELDLEHRMSAFDVLLTGRVQAGIKNVGDLHALARRAIGREALIRVQRSLAAGNASTGDKALVEIGESHASWGQRSVRGALIRRSLRRRSSSAPPSFGQQVGEALRTQVDRVRWTLWKLAGIS